ncbi:MAG: 3-deoxy-manno-octulosonate cytidylyltransferase [Endomicrobia bacterium]|nr:3-deoxy-manno-octulosonate cytidylyltransferase [Endomicrobiia bacterium]
MKTKRHIRVLAVIPARYASTRLPAKPLALINNKPMVQWVYENVKRCKLVDKVIVATDDERIYEIVRRFNGEVMMTSKYHKSGSDRVGEIARKIYSEIVLNVQADEPMIGPDILAKVINELYRNKNVHVVTPICKVEYYSELFDTNFVKVVIDKKGFALYFTRSVIPFVRDGFEFNQQNFVVKNKDLIEKYTFYRHIGIYGFRHNFLFKFLNLPQGNLEKIEKLEQLRILEHGYRIKTVLVKETPISVDTKEDLDRVRKIFSAK